MKRKPIKSGKCLMCGKSDGWGMTGLDKDGNRVTICRACHGAGCQAPGCNKLFSPDNPPVEHRFFFGDRRDEAEWWCQTCHVESIMP